MSGPRTCRAAAGVSGIIDGERMFWGDPLAEFVSPALLGDIEDDADFLAGYAAAGGRVAFDAPARLRMALYRCSLLSDHVGGGGSSCRSGRPGRLEPHPGLSPDQAGAAKHWIVTVWSWLQHWSTAANRFQPRRS